jgi:phosphate/sulfate permease
MSDGASTWSAVMSVAQFLSLGTAVLCDIVMVVVVQTVVRRHRPDAYRPLLSWAIAALVIAIVWPLFTTALSVVGSRDGVGTMLRTHALTTFLSIPVHLVPFALLVRGLIRLAEPPKPVVPEAVGPYR